MGARAVNSHPCGNCGHPLAARWDGGKRAFYCPNCGGAHAAQTPTGDIRRTVDNTISPEAIAGPSGQPLWTVVARLARPGVDNYTETIHVRAVDHDGALLVGREVLLDWIDGEAFQVTEG